MCCSGICFLLGFLVAVEESEAREMANEDGIGHSMTINDELRLFGMTRDDKEDDVRTDVGELFGCSATDLIPLD